MRTFVSSIWQDNNDNRIDHSKMMTNTTTMIAAPIPGRAKPNECSEREQAGTRRGAKDG